VLNIAEGQGEDSPAEVQQLDRPRMNEARVRQVAGQGIAREPANKDLFAGGGHRRRQMGYAAIVACNGLSVIEKH
jgi:hypothetical protein